MGNVSSKFKLVQKSLQKADDLAKEYAAEASRPRHLSHLPDYELRRLRERSSTHMFCQFA